MTINKKTNLNPNTEEGLENVQALAAAIKTAANGQEADILLTIGEVLTGETGVRDVCQHLLDDHGSSPGGPWGCRLCGS